MVERVLMVAVHLAVKIQAKLTGVLLMQPGILLRIWWLRVLCDEVLVQVTYAIGVAQPTSINVDTYGTAKVELTDGEIAAKIMGMKCFDMRPYFIEQRLKLRNPIYSETAAYGHMGRKNEVVEKVFTSPYGKSITKKVELFTWEKLDAVKDVKKVFGLK